MKESALDFLMSNLLLLPALIICLLIVASWVGSFIEILGGTAPFIPLP